MIEGRVSDSNLDVGRDGLRVGNMGEGKGESENEKRRAESHHFRVCGSSGAR